MEFEWDENKDNINIKKHGIGFARAVTIFTGTVLSCEDARKDYGETRIKSIGEVVEGKEAALVVLVAHTNRKGIIRIISARSANKKERRLYYGYLKENR